METKIFNLLKILLFLCLFGVFQAHADQGWRVGGELITPGDSKARVLRIAGPPDLREVLYAREGGVVGNRWYYRTDTHGRLTRILTFRAGRLQHIRTERD